MDSWFYPHSVTPRGDTIPTMRSRLLHVGTVFILVVCLICPLVELFDHWDHTLQTGNDTEYTLVILALCVGVAYSLPASRNLSFPRHAIPLYCFLMRRVPLPSHGVSRNLR